MMSDNRENSSVCFIQPKDKFQIKHALKVSKPQIWEVEHGAEIFDTTKRLINYKDSCRLSFSLICAALIYSRYMQNICNCLEACVRSVGSTLIAPKQLESPTSGLGTETTSQKPQVELISLAWIVDQIPNFLKSFLGNYIQWKRVEKRGNVYEFVCVFYPGGPVRVKRPISRSSESPLWAFKVHMWRLLSSSRVTSSTYINTTNQLILSKRLKGIY